MSVFKPLVLFFLLCLNCSLALAGSGSFTNLRVVGAPSGGPGVVARAAYQCGLTFWDGSSFIVTQQIDVVTITIPSNTQNFLCIGVPPPPEDFDFNLGNLAAGLYTLVLQQAPANAGDSPVALLTTDFYVGFPTPYSNLRVLPNPASTSNRIQLRLFANYNFCPDQTPVISRADNVVKVQFTHRSCLIGTPPNSEDLDFDLGQFPIGNYTLLLQQMSEVNIVVPTLTTSFQVFGAQDAQAVPSDSSWSLVALFLILLAGAWMMRARFF